MCNRVSTPVNVVRSIMNDYPGGYTGNSSCMKIMNPSVERCRYLHVSGDKSM